MKYMVLMYSDRCDVRPGPAAITRKHEALRQDLAGSGEMLNGAGLAYASRLPPDGQQQGMTETAGATLADNPGGSTF